MLPMPSSTSMDMIGRCTTSVGEDHRTITRQVDFIPHWSKGNFGELWFYEPPLHKGALATLMCKLHGEDLDFGERD